MAVLLLAEAANAQVAPSTDLSGLLDFEPSLDSSSLFSGLDTAGASSATLSTTDIRQNGSGNRAEVNLTSSAYGAITAIAQAGMDNIADVNQCACSNLVDIIQDGSANISEITQSGSGNVFVHRQYGEGLSLSVAQYGGAQISITQTIP